MRRSSQKPSDGRDSGSATGAVSGRISGQCGEELACRELRRRGYCVVARNVRTRFGEIDILARRRRCWIAVEVKARRDHPAPEQCLRPAQLQRLARSLRALAPDLRPRPTRLRIDVVTVRWRSSPSRDDPHADLDLFEGYFEVSLAADTV
ncbi:MAG: YraN family protein [Planctomycetota bacterium]